MRALGARAERDECYPASKLPTFTRPWRGVLLVCPALPPRNAGEGNVRSSLLLIPEELQETHPCFQNQVFLEPPKQLEEVTETSTSCSASVEEAFENSAPQSQRPKGCAEKPQSSGAAKPQVLRGSLWAAGLSTTSFTNRGHPAESNVTRFYLA